MRVKRMLVKSVIVSVISMAATFAVASVLNTSAYMADVGSLGAFVTAFGTLYGIITAFIVVEVWSEFNKISELIDREAIGLERLFRLTLYFRDPKLTKRMKDAIAGYANIIIKSKFKNLAQNERNVESGKAFRKIAALIRDVKFDDDHDSIVFNSVVEQYGRVSETRTERLNKSLARLPPFLDAFLYVSSFFMLLFFVIMPYTNIAYGLVMVGTLTFLIVTVIQLIRDLDNPFAGYWNITPEPFERALKHIEQDYG